MSRYVLNYAKVYYGGPGYDLNGLDPKWNEIGGVDDVDPVELTHEVGMITGFARTFKVRLVERFEHPLEGRSPVVIGEHVYAWADGYGIRWDLVEENADG
jgi:hypothetical protein